jgi:phospholipid/cholesterol/gamma-HCH transport system substrate-binding protein
MHASRRFRLGVLALFAGTAFFGLLGFVLQGVLSNERVAYYILFEENVKGMVIGSKVNFQGVPIGMVKDIRFQNGRTLVEVSVDPTKADIQDLTRARLDRLLVTGQVTVELEGYGPTGTSLHPGQFVQPKADPINQLTRTLPELVPQITDLMAKFDVMLDRTNELLDEPNRRHFAAILANTDVAAATLPDTLAQTRALLSNADTAVASLDRAARGAAELMPDARAAAADLRGVGARLDDAVAQGQALLAGVRAPAQSALASLRTSLDELRSLLRQLRLAPDSLIFGVARPAAPAGGGR